MKYHKMKHAVIGLVMLTSALNALPAPPPAPDSQVHPPTLDAQGRFWVYRNGTTHPKMPFTPYGWMSDATNLSQIIQTDVESRDHPNTIIKPPTPERDFCIRLKITWGEATWASVGFISGPDKPAWWGETNTGRHYNFGALPKKKLVFYARGDKGSEVIKAQVGALGDKPFGDSLAKPIVSEELKLTLDWTRFELDLKGASNADLASICNGFGILVERESQSGSPLETQFYIDDVYLE